MSDFVRDARTQYRKIERATKARTDADMTLTQAVEAELDAWADLFAIPGIEAPATAARLLDLPMQDVEPWFAACRRRVNKAPAPKASAARAPKTAVGS